MTVEIRTTVCEIFLSGWRSSQIIWRTQKFPASAQQFPWLGFGTACKSGIKNKDAQYFSHFPKDRNCEVCLRNKMTRASCRRRTCEAPPRAEEFGDLITADHKVVNDGCESRDNHRYAVVGVPSQVLLFFCSLCVKPYAGDSCCRTRHADACQTSQRKEYPVLLPTWANGRQWPWYPRAALLFHRHPDRRVCGDFCDVLHHVRRWRRPCGTNACERIHVTCSCACRLPGTSGASRVRGARTWCLPCNTRCRDPRHDRFALNTSASDRARDARTCCHSHGALSDHSSTNRHLCSTCTSGRALWACTCDWVHRTCTTSDHFYAQSASPAGCEHVCPCSRRWPSMRFLEYERACWIPVFSAIFPGKKTQLLHSACPEQRHRLSPGNSWEGWFFQAILILAPRFWLFGTFIGNNVNAGGLAFCIHEDLLLDEARVTHVVTSQGRDHIVSIRPGGRNLVVVHVHFEPDLTLRSLRERLRPIILATLPWSRWCDYGGLQYLRNTGRKIQCVEPDFYWRWWFEKGCPLPFLFSSCPRNRSAWLYKERLNSWWYNTHIVQDWQDLYQSSCGWSSRLPLLFSCIWESWRRSIPSDHAAVRVVTQKPNIRSNLGKRIPSWMSSHPVFCSDFKVVLEKARKRTFHELST